MTTPSTLLKYYIGVKEAARLNSGIIEINTGNFEIRIDPKFLEMYARLDDWVLVSTCCFYRAMVRYEGWTLYAWLDDKLLKEIKKKRGLK